MNDLMRLFCNISFNAVRVSGLELCDHEPPSYPYIVVSIPNEVQAGRIRELLFYIRSRYLSTVIKIISMRLFLNGFWISEDDPVLSTLLNGDHVFIQLQWDCGCNSAIRLGNEMSILDYQKSPCSDEQKLDEEKPRIYTLPELTTSRRKSHIELNNDCPGVEDKRKTSNIEIGTVFEYKVEGDSLPSMWVTVYNNGTTDRIVLKSCDDQLRYMTLKKFDLEEFKRALEIPLRGHPSYLADNMNPISNTGTSHNKRTKREKQFHAKVRRQVEYFLSPTIYHQSLLRENCKTSEVIDDSGCVWIPLDMIMQLPRMIRMASTTKEVACILSESSKKVIVSSDGNYVSWVTKVD